MKANALMQLNKSECFTRSKNQAYASDAALLQDIR